jgi:hypothetical protein
MTTEFFKEQLRIAEIKREQELTLLSYKVKSKNEVLKEFSKPIIDFLNYINENYSFNKNTHYEHDKKLFNDAFIIKDDITYFTKKLLQINGRDYLTISINDNLFGEISMSHNTTSNFITFESQSCVQLFIEYYCAEVVKVGIKK